jgi:hypothetical protein
MVLHRFRWRVRLAGAGLAMVLVGVAAAWATLLTPQPVVTASGRQFSPAAAPGAAYLAYAQTRPGHPRAFDVYVKPAGMPRFKVNTRGQAFTGGIDGTTLVYQSIRNNQSDIRLFDLVSHTKSVPAGVNTRRWEFYPTISGDWILFGRSWSYRPYNWEVVLHNTTTNETRTLATRINKRHRQVVPGQVSGDFATWASFNSQTKATQLFLYQISTATPTALPATPTGKEEYAPSVSPTGTVFYVRSGMSCGSHVTLREYASGIDTPLAVLPKGYDVDSTFAVDEGGGNSTVYFDRLQCSTGKSHIYKITVS